MNIFLLKVKKERNNGLRYQIYSKELLNNDQNVNEYHLQRKYRKQSKMNNFKKLADSYGWRLKLLEPYIKEIVKFNLKKNNSESSIQINLNNQEVNNSKMQKIEIDEENGVRLALLFKLVSHIRKMKRLDKILLNIKTMSKEEIYYWFSKVFNNEKKQSGLKALRILIGS
ncbi:MAG: DUF7680 family protein [Promethearchaeia archaeon]